MSQLPIIDVQTPVQRTRRSAAATALRCLLVLLIAIAIRVSASRPQTELQDAAPEKQVVTAVAELLPDVEEISPPTADGLQQLSDSNGRVIGFAITTLPTANDVVGYRGPSNVLLILNEALQVVDAKLISSEDTAEHVEIVRNFRFLKNFEGWTLGEANPILDIDAVSGATLTSLAIAEAAMVELSAATKELVHRVNAGEGTIGSLLRDTTMEQDLRNTLQNIQQSAERFNENMEAMRHNFLFRSYFKKLEKQERKSLE